MNILKIIFVCLTMFLFGQAAGAATDDTKDSVYLGKINGHQIYEFKTTDGHTCVLVLRYASYQNAAALQCNFLNK